MLDVKRMSVLFSVLSFLSSKLSKCVVFLYGFSVASLNYIVFKCSILISLLEFIVLQSMRLIVYVTETVFICLQASSRPGPAMDDDKAVGAVSNQLQAFEQRVKKRRGGWPRSQSLYHSLFFTLLSN